MPTDLAWNMGWAGIRGSFPRERSISGRKCSELRVTLCRLDIILSFLGNGRAGPRGHGWLPHKAVCQGMLDTEQQYSHVSGPGPGGLGEAQRPLGGKLLILQTIGKESTWSEQVINFHQAWERQKSRIQCGRTAVSLGRRKQPLNGDVGQERGCAHGHRGLEFSAPGGPPSEGGI